MVKRFIDDVSKDWKWLDTLAKGYEPVYYWIRIEFHSIARMFLIFISWTGLSYTTQYAKKKKNLKKEQSRALRYDIHGGLPIEILTPPERE